MKSCAQPPRAASGPAASCSRLCRPGGPPSLQHLHVLARGRGRATVPHSPTARTPLVRAQPPEHILLQRRVGNVVLLGGGAAMFPRGSVTVPREDGPGGHACPSLFSDTEPGHFLEALSPDDWSPTFLHKLPPELSKISSFFCDVEQEIGTTGKAICSPHPPSGPGVFLAPSLMTRFPFCLAPHGSIEASQTPAGAAAEPVPFRARGRGRV